MPCSPENIPKRKVFVLLTVSGDNAFSYLTIFGGENGGGSASTAFADRFKIKRHPTISKSNDPKQLFIFCLSKQVIRNSNLHSVSKEGILATGEKRLYSETEISDLI